MNPEPSLTRRLSGHDFEKMYKNHLKGVHGYEGTVDISAIMPRLSEAADVLRSAMYERSRLAKEASDIDKYRNETVEQGSLFHGAIGKGGDLIGSLTDIVRGIGNIVGADAVENEMKVAKQRAEGLVAIYDAGLKAAASAHNAQYRYEQAKKAQSKLICMPTHIKEHLYIFTGLGVELEKFSTYRHYVADTHFSRGLSNEVLAKLMKTVNWLKKYEFMHAKK